MAGSYHGPFVSLHASTACQRSPDACTAFHGMLPSYRQQSKGQTSQHLGALQVLHARFACMLHRADLHAEVSMSVQAISLLDWA